MRLGNIIEFKKELYFEGAVQSDWFYEPQKAAKVAENFVFHGKNYFGVDSKKDSIDTVSLVRALVNKLGKDDVNPRTSWRASKELRLQLIEELSKRAMTEAVRLAGGEI